MIHEIQAKTLLTPIRHPDDFYPVDYNMNLYRGCEHQCIYCDSRSECYQIENFNDVLVKVNAVELVQRELSRKKRKGVIGTGAMSDPYGPVERHYNLTGRVLECIATFGFPVNLLTKSDLVLKDLDTLVEINHTRAMVCFTLTTTDDALGKRLEPGAPLVSARLQAMRTLAERGILVGVWMMPILPLIEDSPENITQIVQRSAECGASFILPCFGVTLRDRQRAHFYAQLDRLFPGLRAQYEQRFGERYFCAVKDKKRLENHFWELCNRYQLGTRAPRWQPAAESLPPQQLSLF